MTALENEIYERLKHIVDGIYRKKGIDSQHIRKHFSQRTNFKKLLCGLRDLEHIYKEQKYPINFETTVYDILFYRILMDRIYYEKDNPEVDENASVQNYEKYLESLNEAKSKKLPVERKEVSQDRIENISTRDMKSIVARYEHSADKATDKEVKKNYLDLAKKYKDIIEQREKKMHDEIMINVDKEGRWIPKSH